jgi:hypothetical protein
MINHTYDVLVVYSQDIAISASSHYPIALPFDSKYEVYNDVYAYFLKQCRRNGLTAALTTSKDLTGAGTFSSHWIVEQNKWVAVNQPCEASQIFDKINPIHLESIRQRNLLFSSSEIHSFTDASQVFIFSDKLRSYEQMSEHSVPTVALETPDLQSIEEQILNLKQIMLKHPHSVDFLPETFILKDRTGCGGKNIFKITNNQTKTVLTIMQQAPDKQFVLQPFITFDKGFAYKSNSGFAEIRFIFIGKKIVQTYIRVAAKNEYICNDGSGGIPIKLSEIPKKVTRTAKKIASQITHENSLFALDFIISNSGVVYLLEANATPGIDWHPESVQNVAMNKKMIRLIVVEIKRRIEDENIILPVSMHSAAPSNELSGIV